MEVTIPEQAFLEEEIDTLQELMNIAFGSAAADLAEVIDIFVVLSVPRIKVLAAVDLADYIRNEIKGYDKISIVEQGFASKFKGVALMVFPTGVGKALIAMLGDDIDAAFESDPMDVLERETLMEIGNILIGACVSKVAELLDDVVLYSPPRVLVENLPHKAISREIFDPRRLAIILQTVFQFKEQEVSGFLFLICNHESVGWLKQALNAFLKQYE